MADIDTKKAALEKIKQLLQDPDVQQNLEKGQMFGSGVGIPGQKEYEDMGLSGAPASQFPTLSKLFVPKDSTYQGGGVSDRQMGIPSPAIGQPSFNRAGGSLDMSPAELASKATSVATDPYTYAPGVGAGIKPLRSFTATKKLITPSEYIARQTLENPEARQLMAADALRGKPGLTPTLSAEDKDILQKAVKKAKLTGEDTNIPDEE